ncbi:putative guanosine-diphosphatase [Golovinomyces cichoracearum]|uniref:guanosine-diphosphatase n=1 Tax=Golovinomyces cichoracearum TaxID=62708 RepID=A0A420H6Z8_9PEZI|nr:putative guanosine-diphosphatase [Golovinomyces cichoracearum]
MKRNSISRKARNTVLDPHEKPSRYQPRGAKRGIKGLLEKIKIAWMTQSPRSRYLKTGGILFLAVFLVYYLLPGVPNFQRVTKLNIGQTPSNLSVGTKKCSNSFDSTRPLIQYVLMIDAGSTGSRIHVYKFNNCGPTPDLEHEEFKMTEKKSGGSGLSSYKDDYEGAARSLDVLMDVAMKTVPDELKSCTPVAVKATAGLRLLGSGMSEKILEAVRNRLENVYPFPVVSSEENGVAIMDGKDEGAYAWITTNYLLGKIGGQDQSQTVAVLDLGGGSTQIVFEPKFKDSSNEKFAKGKLADTDFKYNLSFGGQEYQLYQNSYLGYGLMSARESIHKTLIETIFDQNSSNHTWITQPVINPCITSGMSRQIEINLGANHKLGDKISVNMTGPPSPVPALCRRLAEKILFKDANCVQTPCSFNGVYQPSIASTFASGDFYTLSYFYDRINPLGMPETFDLDELHELTNKVCSGESQWKVFASVPGALEELRGRPEHCLDLSYIFTLLQTGYEIPRKREIKIAKKVKNNELGWCLGASLPLLNHGSGWQCRIKEA